MVLLFFDCVVSALFQRAFSFTVSSDKQESYNLQLFFVSVFVSVFKRTDILQILLGYKLISESNMLP